MSNPHSPEPARWILEMFAPDIPAWNRAFNELERKPLSALEDMLVHSFDRYLRRKGYLTKEQVEVLEGIAGKHNVPLPSIPRSSNPLELTEGLHVEEAYPEVWKTKQYLAGVIDSEGSFNARSFYGTRSKKWYLQHRFDIKLLGTKEWGKMADYLKSTYGGGTYVEGRYYIRWVLPKAEDLLRFLNDFIPYLSIKRTDAERLRESLIAYKEFVDKGKPTAEYWREWLRKFKLRELKPLIVLA